jgi:hypothetical protein
MSPGEFPVFYNDLLFARAVAGTGGENREI